MNIGDRVKFLQNVSWDGTVIPKGTIAMVEEIKTTGVFVRPRGWAEAPIYAFRKEIQQIQTTLKIRAKGVKLWT